MTNIFKFKNKLKLCDYFFILSFLAFFCLLLWKIYYGFGGRDEAFYLTIPDRLFNGDALLSEEWHLSQLSGLVTLPLFYLYKFIFKTNEGIIFAFRFMYVIFKSLSCIFIYKRLKKYTYFAVVTSIIFYFSSNALTLNYHSICIEFLAIVGVGIGTSNFSSKIEFVIYGILFSCAVLCCPYLAIVYIIYAVIFLINILLKKYNTNLLSNIKLFI